jgi:hypothetical protein
MASEGFDPFGRTRAAFKMSGAPLPPRLTAAGIRATLERPWEPMTSLLSKPRPFTISYGVGTAGIADFLSLEVERPSILRMQPQSFGAVGTPGSPTLSMMGLEAVPGDRPVTGPSSQSMLGFANSGRSLILPWGGRWNLRLTTYGNLLVPQTCVANCIVWEAVPGVTAADLIAIAGFGRGWWMPFSVTTADVLQHPIWGADPHRTYLILQNTSGNTFRVALDGTDPSVPGNFGFLLGAVGSQTSVLAFSGVDTPLDDVRVAATTAAAATLVGFIAHG